MNWSAPHVAGFRKCLRVWINRVCIRMSSTKLFSGSLVKQKIIFCYGLFILFGITNIKAQAPNPGSIAITGGATSACITSGTSPSAFISVTDASGGGGPLFNNYVWERSSTNDFAIYTAVSNTASFTETITLTAVTYYRRKVINSLDLQFAYSNIIQIGVLPTASITGTLSVCKNSTQPNIRITGSGGTAPYTFTYTVNGGASQMTTTSGGSSFVDIPVPTSTVGSFVYFLVSVQESSASSCSNSASGSATITVNDLPTVVSVSPSTPAVCLGTLSFVETLTTTQNPDQYKITWSAAAIAKGFTDVVYAANNLPPSGSITINIPATATAGTYSGTLVIKNSTTACESDPGSAFLVINPLPTITGTLAVCVGATTALAGSGTASSTTPWLSSNNAIATVNSLGVVSGVAAGVVSITYTNNNNCQEVVSVTVNAVSSPKICYIQKYKILHFRFL